MRYARRAAAWVGKLACTDVRISDGQRTASDVVTSWAEEDSRMEAQACLHRQEDI
ncbi:MAG TPA: hypothetical protein IAB26_15500 [Candidatus Limivivens merdigallinarum]|uniref:Uncharacterized protein n=1 Tax=Candidatus Limivivens merdigallinarum TaxID=2840859 RepID=A0A9D1D3K2_9FIRM|nr:hypothetical protein [Candidatus Limivivens merdigallinarum]